MKKELTLTAVTVILDRLRSNVVIARDVEQRHCIAHIIVITVAHNPLRPSRVPVYTNQCKHS